MPARKFVPVSFHCEICPPYKLDWWFGRASVAFNRLGHVAPNIRILWSMNWRVLMWKETMMIYFKVIYYPRNFLRRLKKVMKNFRQYSQFLDWYSNLEGPEYETGMLNILLASRISWPYLTTPVPIAMSPEGWRMFSSPGMFTCLLVTYKVLTRSFLHSLFVTWMSDLQMTSC
jgi:hypothetical protein